MKLPVVLLILSAILLVLMGVVPWFGSSLPGPQPHPQFESMQKSGDPGPLWLAWSVGVAMMAFFGTAMALGFSRSREARLWTWAVTGAYGLLYVLLLVSYDSFSRSTEPVLIAGFPIPTGLLVYGVYLFPVVLLLIPVLGFRRWFYTTDDEARFQSLLDRRDAPGTGD